MHPNKENDFTVAFGSCNKQKTENTLWKEIQKNKPNLWVGLMTTAMRIQIIKIY